MTAYQTTEQIIEQAVVTARTDAMDASELTDADLKNLSDERLRELMTAGQLVHLGLGKPKPRGRYR